jgi:hypothetical protein
MKKPNPFMEMIAKKKEVAAKKPAEKMAKGGAACAPKKMAKGGGIESKGKTKGKMVTMKKGGKAC